MKYIFCSLLSGSLLLLMPCCSTPAGREKVNTGAITARTFSFVRTSPLAGTDDREPVHRMIQAAITRNLAAKGVSKTASTSDLTVAYLVIIGNNVSTEVISDHFGHSAEVEKLTDKAHDAYTGSENRNYFQAGTLVIDIIDSHTHKLLKRSYTTRPLLRDVPVSRHNAKVQEAVDAILADLRISR